MIVLDSKEAKLDNKICAFNALLNAKCEDEVLRLRDVQDADYMPFWDSMAISERLDDGEHRVVFWGTNLVKNYGKDHTGKLMNECDVGYNPQMVSIIENHVIAKKKCVFVSGKIDWENQDYAGWNRIIVPIVLAGNKLSSLSIINFCAKKHNYNI